MSFIRILSKYKPILVGITVLIVIYVLAALEPTEELNNIGDIILVPATFLWGIFAGFYISIAVGENAHMRETTLAEIGSLDVIVSTIGFFDKKHQKQFIKLVDNYVRELLEYEASEAMVRSEKQYEDLKDSISVLDMNKSDYYYLVKKTYDTFDIFYDARQRRYMISGNIIRGFSWVILWSLSIMIIAGFVLQSPAHIVYDVLIVLASAAITIVMFTIYEIDNFVYRENHDVFLQYRVLYKDMGMSPYYPYESIKYKRAIPIEEPLRIGYLSTSGRRQVVEYKAMPHRQLLKAIDKDFKRFDSVKR